LLNVTETSSSGKKNLQEVILPKRRWAYCCH